MTTPMVTELVRNGNPVNRHAEVGERVELGRYRVHDGERILYGQRVNGHVRLVDVPSSKHGRSYLIERELEQDGYAALLALVADYIRQGELHGAIPMSTAGVRWLIHFDDTGADR